MDPKFVAWLAAGLLSVAALCQLMRARQAKLMAVLHDYVQSRREWSHKRAKAARLADRLAQSKAEEEATRAENPDDFAADFDSAAATDPLYDKYRQQNAA